MRRLRLSIYAKVGTYFSMLFVLSATPSQSQFYTNVIDEFNIVAGVSGYELGSGVSFFDVNDDGLDDITLVRDNQELIVHLSTGASFSTLHTGITLPSKTVQVLWVDYDNDGDLDLFFTVFDGVNQMYQNQGGFIFTNVTAEIGLDLDPGTNSGAAFGDFDRDGHLDLYIVRWESAFSTNFLANELYRNNGDGTFSNVTDLYNVSDGPKPSFIGCWIDINKNLFPDLFIINERSPSNTLFRNDSGVGFTNITQTAGVGYPFSDPMSITAGDYNNDGLMDIFITNQGPQINMPLVLLRNNGNETFTDVADDVGITAFSTSWGGVWVDIDNDGWRDLFYCMEQLVPNHLYKSINGQQFEFIPHQVQAPNARSFVCVSGDYNGDGQSDIFVSNQPPQAPQLLKNTHNNTNNYVKVRPRGTVSNLQGVGTWIEVYANENTWTHYTLCGENYVAQNTQNILFGLGEAGLIDSLKLTYSSGHTDTYYSLSVNERYTPTEGETYIASITVLGDTLFCEGGSTVLDAGDHHAYSWSNGINERTIEVLESGVYTVTVSNPYGITTSASVMVEVAPLPEVFAIATPLSCHDSQDAQIALNLQSAAAMAEVSWAHGPSESSIDSLGAGSYFYTLTDTNGCSSTGEVEITAPEALIALIQVNPITPDQPGSILVSAFGGQPPYEVSLNGLPANLNNLITTPGTYEVSITDAAQCSYTEILEVPTTVNADTRDMVQPKAYPNPTSDWLHLEVPDYQINDITLYDMQGRMLQTIKLVNGKVNLDPYPDGLYNISIRLTSGRIIQTRILKIQP